MTRRAKLEAVANQRGSRRVDAGVAQQWIHNHLRRLGASSHVARCVAAHLVDADLAGHPSHGVRRILEYKVMVERGECDLAAEPRVVRRRGAMTTIDGCGGLGHPALALGTDEALKAAANYGVGLSAVVRCGHGGRLGAWAERAAAQNAIGMVFLAKSDGPFVLAPSPDAEAALSTNPLAVGIPAREEPVILDIATSTVAEGKVALALARGESVEPGILVDRTGCSSTDPAALYAGGALLPFGGHKGFGLAVVIEALSISLTGADEDDLSPLSGALVVCLSADLFRSLESFLGSVERLRVRLRGAGRAAAVVLPGEPEATSRRASSRIVIDPEVLAALGVASRPPDGNGWLTGS